MKLRRITVTIVLPILTALAVAPGFCFAWCPGCCIIDCHTRYMWARTWHGPNDLAMPLDQYYVPRTPGVCGHGYNCTAMADGGCGAAAVPTGQYGAVPYGARAAAGFEPVQFERLGKVPNELDVIGAVPAPGGPPAAGPRR